MMIRLHYVTAVLALMMVPALQPALAQQSGQLQDRMSASDFYNAGLNKLSAKELATLNQWLVTHQGGTSSGKASARVASEAPMESKAADTSSFFGKSDRHKVESRMVGHFAGFTGDSLVTLDNGQQWQQVGDDQTSCNASDSPSVKVKPSLFGNWLMDVHGCNKLVHVKRVK